MSPDSSLTPPRLRLVKSTESAERPPRPSLDDTELLTAVRSGDRGVAGALYDRARPQIERTINRLLGFCDMDRDDLAQVAALELITTIDRYRGDCSLDSWIGTITAHVVYKHIRRRKLERQFFSAGPWEEGAHSNPNGHDAVGTDLAARVRSHLQAIDSNKAWTFMLHDVWGYDLKEIAQITGASIAAAQSRLVRGRRDLHDRIAEDPELADMLDTEEPR